MIGGKHKQIGFPPGPRKPRIGLLAMERDAVGQTQLVN
jgi:hypothetical protein